MIGQGCDVIFGVGGNTGNGGLLAAKEANLMAIGVDVDQYNTYPEVQSALISSAMKNVDVAVYNYLKSVSDKSVKAGAVTRQHSKWRRWSGSLPRLGQQDPGRCQG